MKLLSAFSPSRAIKVLKMKVWSSWVFWEIKGQSYDFHFCLLMVLWIFLRKSVFLCAKYPLVLMQSLVQLFSSLLAMRLHSKQLEIMSYYVLIHFLLRFFERNFGTQISFFAQKPWQIYAVVQKWSSRIVAKASKVTHVCSRSYKRFASDAVFLRTQFL